MTDTPARRQRLALPGYATQQRQIIAGSLADHAEFITVQDLHHLMREAGHHIGLSTVYRTLNALVAAEAADTFRDAAGVQHYRARTTPDHQHYLLCRTCGSSLPITSDAIEHWAVDTARHLGFAEVVHVIELSGICRECQ